MKGHSMIIIVCFLLAVNVGWSLVCKKCNIDCKDPYDEECLEPGESQTVACLQEVFSDTDGNILEERKCVIFQSDIRKFECVGQPGYTTISCRTCSESLCNNVAPVLPTKNNTQQPLFYRNVTRPNRIVT